MNQVTPELIQASSHEAIVELQVEAISNLSKQLGRPLSIAEAGCGQRWLIDLAGIDYTLTGIDLDAAALELRRTTTCDLDYAICGDLCSVDIPSRSFDVVYSFYVLEHVPQADLALQNFVKWLKPGGLLLLRLPDPDTVRAFFARSLPHFIHVWYHRYVYGTKLAGHPGYAPYRTCYHPVIGREQLCQFLTSRGMTLLGCYGDGYRREGTNRFISAVIKALSKLVSIASFGKLTSQYADVMYVAVKNLEA